MEGQQLVFDRLTERELEILKLMADGLSNHEIAQTLFLTHGTIKWYSRQIYSKLGVNNRTQAISHLGKLSSPEPQLITTLYHRRHLPMPLTSFVGRHREIHEIKQLLTTKRLITLTGPGGSGKTRLALEVASTINHAFANGAAFVDLSAITHAATVINAIAHALDITENPDIPLPEILKRALRSQEILLLIDNFEHVIEAAPLLADLLMGAPQIKMLVTSRAALHLSGEQEHPVLPLSLPDSGSVAIEHLIESEAITLFRQQARSAQPHFEITSDNAPAIAEICLRLDGLPLAIELAAARCKLLSPQALLNRLSSRLDALNTGPRDVPARQQTLRNTLDWSYDLLNEAEKLLFARLAVFRGGRSLEAIEVVCTVGLTEDIFHTLTGLLDKSLIYRKDTPTGEPRFWMLETIHGYAWEQLAKSSEVESMRRQHAEYFVDLAERAEPELRLAQHDYWSQLLELELHNLRGVLEWSLGDGDNELGARLAGALYLFWWAYGYHVEGRYWTHNCSNNLTTYLRYTIPNFF